MVVQEFTPKVLEYVGSLGRCLALGAWKNKAEVDDGHDIRIVFKCGSNPSPYIAMAQTVIRIPMGWEQADYQSTSYQDGCLGCCPSPCGPCFRFAAPISNMYRKDLRARYFRIIEVSIIAAPRPSNST